MFVCACIPPLSALTLLLSGTRSSLMRRLVPQSLASSSSAISCRWNTATWADRRLTLPLGVRSKSSPGTWLCTALSLSFSLDSLSFSPGLPATGLSCSHSLLSVGWLCSFRPPAGDSSEITWRRNEGGAGEKRRWFYLPMWRCLYNTVQQ